MATMQQLLVVVLLAVVWSASASAAGVAEVEVEVGDGAPSPCKWTYPSGDKVDLTPLYLEQGEYYARSEGYIYRGNVCGQANFGVLCSEKGYTLCQFSEAGGFFVASLGSFSIQPKWSVISLPHSQPEPEENGVQYTFTNGDVCWKESGQSVRTVINVFRCVDEPTSLNFTVVEDTICTFIVEYRSSLACKNGGSKITNSIYTDEKTRSKWDLTPLHRIQGTGDYVSASGAYNYSMNIGDLTTVTGPCRTGGHSICQWDHLGQYYAGLGGFYMKPPGLWSLIAADPSVGIRQTYTNGESCWIAGKQVPRTSIISYYCDHTGPRQFQVVVDASTCTYKFNWYVSEGCPSRA